MNILFFIAGIIGLFMFYFGIKTLVKNYRNKIIGELNLTENEINFEKSGLYSISVVGGSFVNNSGNFFVKIFNNETTINYHEKQLKFKFHYKNKLATEFIQFDVEKVGIYKIILYNVQELEIKKSMLFSKRLFQKKIQIGEFGFIIKETSSSIKFIIGILMTVFGIHIAIWGFILAYNS